MRKIKIVMLLMGLLLFSSEVFAENNVTSEVDENNISASNHEVVDDWDEALEAPDFEALEALDKESKALDKESKALDKESKALDKMNNLLTKMIIV